jgi:hypothetical protein
MSYGEYINAGSTYEGESGYRQGWILQVTQFRYVFQLIATVRQEDLLA